jgi:hypothetical protein
MGALENVRFQSELSRFREQLVTWQVQETQTPGAQLQLSQSQPHLLPHHSQQCSPGAGWRRVPLVLQEEVDSVSDLESILEYPDEG